jgi:purine-binding chemotaxis protein CheW
VAVTPGDGGSSGRRRELVERVERLEGELAVAEAELAALGPEAIPGLHLAVDVAGRRALLPAGRVREIVRFLAVEPLPVAPPAVLGTFVLRGEPVTVLDLARVVGVEREPSLDATIVVFGGAPAVGVLVDAVLSVELEARRAQGKETDETGGAWGAGLVAGLCRWREGVLPLLHVPTLLRAAEGPR